VWHSLQAKQVTKYSNCLSNHNNIFVALGKRYTHRKRNRMKMQGDHFRINILLPGPSSVRLYGHRGDSRTDRSRVFENQRLAKVNTVTVTKENGELGPTLSMTETEPN